MIADRTEILDGYGRPAEARGEILVARAREALADFRKEIRLAQEERNNSVAERENASSFWPVGNIFQYPQNAAYGPSSAVSGPITLSMANNYVPVSLNRILLSYAYMTNGFVKTLTREPVDDAFKGGFDLESGDMKPDELKEIVRDMKRIRSRRELLKNRRSIGQKVQNNAGNDLQRSDISAIKHTLYWGRLYGGAGLIINCDQDFRKELDPELIGEDSPLSFIPADRWELVLGDTNLFADRTETPFNYYGYPLHVSRVQRFMWNEMPAYIRLRLQGWGGSIIEQAIRPINAYLKMENLIFELMDEAKTDVYKLKNLAGVKSSGRAEEALRATMEKVNQIKNYHNALVIDMEDDYQQKTLPFTGIAEIRMQGRMDLASALRFPLTKLFGDSSTGFGGGQDAMENYNSVVNDVREGADPIVIEVAGLRCQQRFGYIPEDLKVKWKPLREMSGPEEQQCQTLKHTRNMDLFDRDLMDGQETMMAEKQDGIVTIDTQVGLGKREVLPPMQQEAELGMQAQEAAGKQQMQLQKAKPKPGAGARR